MAIIRYTKDATIRYAYLNIFPDQFKTEKQKRDDSWVKNKIIDMKKTLESKDVPEINMAFFSHFSVFKICGDER